MSGQPITGSSYVPGGKIIAVIDTTTTIGSIEYNLDFATGLSYQLVTGTAADVTISFS